MLAIVQNVILTSHLTFIIKPLLKMKRIRFEIWYLFYNIRRIFHLKPFQWEQFCPITKELEWNTCKLQAKMIIVIFFICLKCEIYIFNVIRTQTCFFFSLVRCSRLGLSSLAYLWRRDQQELLSEMISSGIEAVLIKVAAMGT